jgi:hypothetical protein
VKQILRAGGFDERRYGFGGLIDLLRACQRDGLVRMERDRRGGLRVFQGSAIRPTTSHSEPGEPAAAIEMDAERETETETEIETVEAVVASDAGDLDVIEVEPVSVIDTTAELLGRAKPRRPRTRAAGPPASGAATPSSARGARAAGGQRKPAAKKAPGTPRRTTRGRKAPEASGDDRGNR